MASYGGSGSAQQAVSGPSTALLVCGILNVVLMLISIVANVTGMTAGPKPPPGAKGADDAQMIAMFSGTMGIVFNLLGLAANVVIILASQKMKAMQSYGLAMTGSILAVIPCLSCCITGIPIGIWCIVTLNKPEVKSSFS